MRGKSVSLFITYNLLPTACSGRLVEDGIAKDGARYSG